MISQPDAGTVRHGANVQIAYYDQQREQLDPERTVFDTVGDGNDTVTINGQPRHVHGYLRDFLFGAERARSPVKALSGGERNRLLLARLFTRPANVLVMDEPTNDLDLETLELLEAQLVEWPGTLASREPRPRVSRQRRDEHARLRRRRADQEYVGGYADWLRQRRRGSADGGRSRQQNAEQRRNGRAVARGYGTRADETAVQGAAGARGAAARASRRSSPSRPSCRSMAGRGLLSARTPRRSRGRWRASGKWSRNCSRPMALGRARSRVTTMTGNRHDLPKRLT